MYYIYIYICICQLLSTWWSKLVVDMTWYDQPIVNSRWLTSKNWSSTSPRCRVVCWPMCWSTRGNKKDGKILWGKCEPAVVHGCWHVIVVGDGVQNRFWHLDLSTVFEHQILKAILQNFWNTAVFGTPKIGILFIASLREVNEDVRSHFAWFDGYQTPTGWWFGTCFIFPYIGLLITPIDELIFFRGVAEPPTSQFPCLLGLS